MSRIGFLLAEDEAIKNILSSITVTDDRNNARSVEVFFRYPESETERSYPFITIEHIDIIHARNRQHSESDIFFRTGANNVPPIPAGSANRMDYWPSVSSTFSFKTGKNNYGYLEANEHVPIDLLYQISTFTRTALHDRHLTAKILTEVFPWRRGFIDIGADNTIRRLDLLDWTTADLLDPEAGYRKRIFRKVYTVQMTAEIPSSRIVGRHAVTKIVGNVERINSVNGSVYNMADGSSETFSD
jgi:hypothetical protein